MPAILAPGHFDKWLDPDFGDTAVLTAMLQEKGDFVLESVQVGPRVNSPANDDPLSATRSVPVALPHRLPRRPPE